MKSLILICAVGMAFGQNGPITFCAADDDAASVWIQSHQLWPRIYVRRADMDHGCLDKTVGYEALPVAISKKNWLIEGNIYQNSWQGQSDQSNYEYDRKKPEPLDVPAIQEDYISAKKGDSMPNNNGWMLYYGEDQHSKKWTCADKERILEHSESGKFWCRKVQN